MQKTPRKRFLLGTLAIAAAVFLAAAAAIVWDGLADEIAPADVGVVLGNAVELDGRPSARLEARLDKAIELYRRGLFPRTIVSGAVGKEGHDEAEFMRAYLVEKGVPPESIIADREGATTYLTARNASRIMTERGWKSALVVSQYFHLSRVRLALERFGVSDVRSAHAERFEMRDLYSIPREVVAYCVYSFRSYAPVEGR